MNIVDISKILPWNTKVPWKRWKGRKLSAINTIVIHHSASSKKARPESINRYHIESNKWPRIGYHYYILDDGTIFKTNAIQDITYHAGNANSYSIGICIAGNFDAYVPTEAQVESALYLCDILIQAIPSVKNVIGHHDCPGYLFKSCPGIKFYKHGYMSKLQALLPK